MQNGEVTVTPRINVPRQEHGSEQNSLDGGQHTPAHENSTQGGLFTSLYENKMIVLGIVIFVIIVIIAAYVFFKKPAAATPPVKDDNSGQQINQSATTQQANPAQSTLPNQNTQPTSMANVNTQPINPQFQQMNPPENKPKIHSEEHYRSIIQRAKTPNEIRNIIDQPKTTSIASINTQPTFVASDTNVAQPKQPIQHSLMSSQTVIPSQHSLASLPQRYETYQNTISDQQNVSNIQTANIQSTNSLLHTTALQTPHNLYNSNIVSPGNKDFTLVSHDVSSHKEDQQNATDDIESYINQLDDTAEIK